MRADKTTNRLFEEFWFCRRNDRDCSGYQREDGRGAGCVRTAEFETGGCAIEARRQVAVRYREELKNVPGIRVMEDMPGVRHNYSYFPIFVNAERYGMTRDELYTRMKKGMSWGGAILPVDQ